MTVGIQLLGFVDLIYGIRAKREIIAATERGKKKTDLVEDLAARDVLLFNVATLSKTWRETSGISSQISRIFLNSKEMEWRGKNEDFSRCLRTSYIKASIHEAKISVRHDKYYEYYEYAMNKALDRYVI